MAHRPQHAASEVALFCQRRLPRLDMPRPNRWAACKPRMHWLAAAGLVGGLLLSGCGRMREGSLARPIRVDNSARGRVPSQEGNPHQARPLAAPTVPPHPFMAPHGASCMHADAFTSNTYAWAGPLGTDTEVASRSMGFLGGECPTINFDRQGRIVTVCVRERQPSLLLLDPQTLTVLDRHVLPRRHTPILRVRKMMDDTSGGAYFYLDNSNRAVVGNARGKIEIVGVHETETGPTLVQEEVIDLRAALTHANGRTDKLTAVMPDYEGNIWFSARYGKVGFVTPDRQVHVLSLPGEEVQNAFSIAPDGVYLVSDHALYRLARDTQGKPRVLWREAYDRGHVRKVGQINQGSGTTPTILGDQYIAIADNAEPRMNVLVYERRGESARRVCKVPVFAAGKSATENTLIGHGRSLIVENNAGYDIFRTMRGGRTSAPGLARIDVREDGTGCDVVWESQEIAQTSVPKLSAATGLVYVYTKRKDPALGLDAYYFTALDFFTGRTVFRVLTGTGVRYDNNWASISLAPNGSAYVGVLNGLLRIRDRPLAASMALQLPAPL